MKERIQAAVKEALKARDKVRLDTLRGVLSVCQYEAMEKKVEELEDEAIVQVLQRELKKRKEEIDFATQAKREDLLEKLALEVRTISEFLPEQLSADQLRVEISTILSAPTATKNVGLVMKTLKEKYSGRYDPKLASDIVKQMCAA